MNARTILVAAGLGLLVSSMTAGAVGAAQGRTQTNRTGPVTVAITPITVTPGEPLALEVVLDTHSVDLSGVAFDRVVVVHTGAGPVAPAKIESAKGEGHHRKAVLVFPASAVTRDLRTLEVLVRDVGGVPERRFAFDLPLEAAEAAPPAQPSASPGAGAAAGGGMMGQGMMGDMPKMMERMREMQRQTGEMPRMGQPMPSPR